MILMVTFGLKEIFILLFGIFIGIVLGTFYFIKRKRKLILSHINKQYQFVPNEEKEIIESKINKIYSYHQKSRKTKIKLLFGLITIKKKVNQKELLLEKLNFDKDDNLPLSITNEIWWLINEVAKIYYPNSDKPIFELSIDEILLLTREICSLLYNILNDLGIPNLEKIKINQLNDLIKVTGKVSKIYNIRGIKFTVKVFNAAIKIQSVITPIYWIKKGTNVLTISSLSQFIIKSMFELIAKETANIYSKNFIEN